MAIEFASGGERIVVNIVDEGAHEGAHDEHLRCIEGEYMNTFVYFPAFTEGAHEHLRDALTEGAHLAPTPRARPWSGVSDKDLGVVVWRPAQGPSGGFGPKLTSPTKRYFHLVRPLLTATESNPCGTALPNLKA
jgi:hypothetical protein